VGKKGKHVFIIGIIGFVEVDEEEKNERRYKTISMVAVLYAMSICLVKTRILSLINP